MGGGASKRETKEVEIWNRELWSAAVSGEAADVENFLRRGADVNCRYGCSLSTPLFHAARRGRLEMVKILIANGADINTPHDDGDTPLLRAVKEGHSKVAIELITRGADPNIPDQFKRLALHHLVTYAASDDIIKVMRLTKNLRHQDDNGNSPLHYLMSSKNVRPEEMRKVVQKFLKSGDMHSFNKVGFTPVHVAVLEKNKVLLDQLREESVDINAPGGGCWYPLHFAAWTGSTDVIECLLSCEGCDVNAPSDLGLTGVHCAAMAGAVDVLERLRKAGAELHRSDDDGYSALHYAAMLGHVAVIRYLLRNGANIETVDTHDRTALHHGVRYRHVEAADTLVDAGANVHCKDKYRLEPANYLSSFEQSQYIGRILSGGQAATPYVDLADDDQVCSPSVTETTSLYQLKNRRGVGQVKSIPEFHFNDFVKSVKGKVETIITGILSGFRSSNEEDVGVVGCGSSFDGSKCGLPDELDFLVILQTIVKSRGNNTTPTDGYEKMPPRIDLNMNGFQNYAVFVWERLFTFWLNHRNDSHDVGHGSVQILLPPQRRPNRTACINWVWMYSDAVFTHLPVSIDIVPALEVNCGLDYFPDEVKMTIPLVDPVDSSDMFECGFDEQSDTIKGYVVPKVPQTRHWRHVPDMLQCQDLTNFGRISFPTVESRAIKQTTQWVRDVLTVAKAVRNPEICGFKVKKEDGELVDAADFITSYHLKTVFLRIMSFFEQHHMSLEAMVCLLYDMLVDHYKDQTLPMALVPGNNVLVGSRLNPRDCLKVAKTMVIALKDLRRRGTEHYK